ncbi:MAG TPA: rhodanese-like domain-containing protein, partial [Actinomycetes bacterium]|nr:rhodanese-like domain-containing protein [Actinomycetes bacterium]
MADRPIISVAELHSALLGAQPPTVLDVRWSLAGPPGRELYGAGHIPTASFCDLDTDLADPPSPRVTQGRHPLPDPSRFQAAMRRLGVRGGGDVVVYDAADASVAARAWWCLRYYGHRQVRVLDGGFAAWQAGGHSIEQGEATAPPMGDFVAEPGNMPTVAASDLPDLVATGLLIDARAAVRYRGESEPVDPVAGHIPGAVN